ncbi:MAG: hypothetical protein JO112_23200, partial [Planctomycetes bacterium]|nr:hypothetical protein [Planctomycetota bacterium]
MMIFPWMLLVVSVALVLVQFLAAVPWLWVLNVDLLRRWWPRATLQEVLRRVAAGLGLLGLGGVALALWLGFFVREPENLQFWGGAF